MHRVVQAHFARDTAQYTKVGAAQKAIAKYRMDLNEAWTAMELPYCGYGAYGTASAIKSYWKTVERGRAAFFSAARSFHTSKRSFHPKKIIVTAAMISASERTPARHVARTHIRVSSISNIVIHKGLHRGIRSSAVRNLQLLLTSYFGIPPDGNHVTGYFGPVTEGLVLRFQLKRGVIPTATSPGAGMVGPLTSAALNKI